MLAVCPRIVCLPSKQSQGQIASGAFPNELPLPERVSLAYCCDLLLRSAVVTVAGQCHHSDPLQGGRDSRTTDLVLGWLSQMVESGNPSLQPLQTPELNSVEYPSIYTQFRILNSPHPASLSCAAGDGIKSCFVRVIVHCTKHNRDWRCLYFFFKKCLTNTSVI